MISTILSILAMGAAEPAKAEPRRDPASWVRARDLPRIDGDAAVTTFDLTIDDEGNPVNCVIIVESGQDGLDASVCDAVMKRARFKPAKDRNGSNVYSVRRDRVNWFPNAVGRNISYDAADVVVRTPAISEEKETLLDVILTIDAEGSVTRCDVPKNEGNEELISFACQAASDPQIASPIRDEAAVIRRGIRSLFVAVLHGEPASTEIR